MPTVSIPAGQTKELISGNPGDVFFLSVESGEIRVGPNQSLARLGRPLGDDDRGELTLRERQEEIHAFASGDSEASVIIERQGFEINLFSRKVVRRPGDAAAENLEISSAEVFDSDGVSTGSFEGNTLLENNGDSTIFVEQVTWSTENTSRDYLEADIEFRDSAGNDKHEIALVDDSYINFDPSIPMESGDLLRVGVWNFTGQLVKPYFTVNYRQ